MFAVRVNLELINVVRDYISEDNNTRFKRKLNDPVLAIVATK